MPPDRVILVHGLWMNGLEFGVLRRRLEQDHGFDVHVFAYPTLSGNAEQIAEELAEFAARIGEGGRVHLVGHSLGGAIVFRTLLRHGAELDGNAVLLGSPLAGSRAARKVAHWRALRSLLGPHVLHEFTADRERSWPGPNAVGAIAGCRRVGIGRVFAHFDEDHDGTVAVSETRVPGLNDHLVLRHSHMGMLFADDVARQVASFLREGRFRRADAMILDRGATKAHEPGDSADSESL